MKSNFVIDQAAATPNSVLTGTAIATAISDEGRAKYHEALRRNGATAVITDYRDLPPAIAALELSPRHTANPKSR